MRRPFYESENLDIFFKSVFSEDCFLKNKDSGEYDILVDCFYDNNFDTINDFTQNIVSQNIFIRLKNQDIESYNIRKGTPLKVRGVKYTVKEFKFNGNGISICDLTVSKDRELF